MHRRLFLVSSVSLLLIGTARADDAEIARKLVGKWAAKQYVENVGEIESLLTLAGNGEFALTSTASGGIYQAFQQGNWTYGGGWISFVTTYSEPRDPNNNYLVMAPLQVLEVTDTELKTQLGNATRVG